MENPDIIADGSPLRGKAKSFVKESKAPKIYPMATLELLPKEIFFHVFSFMKPREFVNAFQVSHRMNQLLNHDSLWMQLVEDPQDIAVGRQLVQQEGIAWKEFYKRLHRWRWSSLLADKGPEITVSDDGLTSSRLVSTGRNPAVFATEPLTKTRSHFRVEIVKLGNWVGVGIADKNFVLSGSSTLGTQSSCLNSSYFYQNSGIKKLQMHGESAIDGVAVITAGDIIDVVVDFASHMICYYNNEVLQGVITCVKNTLVPGQIYPCVNLSSGTAVALRNHDNKPLSINFRWSWSSSGNRKADCIVTSSDQLYAKREGKGMNPAVLTKYPFTRKNPHVRLEVAALGNWIGLGLCDSHFVVNNAATLGTQNKGINAAYFYQNTGLHKLQMAGEKSKDGVMPISVGDVIDIVVDFDAQRIYFYNNERLQGYLPSSKVLREGTLYPCANLSVGSEVLLRQETPKLEKNKKWKALLAELPSKILSTFSRD